MKKNNLLFSFLALAIFLSSCGGIKPLSISDIESVKMSGMRGANIVVEATFRVKNPNGLGFTVKASDMDLYANGSLVGKAALKDNIKIARKSDKSYVVNIEANLAQLMFNGLMNFASISKSGKAKIRMKGELKVSKFLFIKKKFPVDMEKSVNLGKLE